MLPKNLTVIKETDSQEIADVLKGSKDIHVTNGVYSYPADLIVPTTLAGFKYISDEVASKEDTFVIAVNSDISMREIYKRKKKNLDAQRALPEKYTALKEEQELLESKQIRAEKVAVPLAQLDPARKIVVVFFDTETPTPLYEKLAKKDYLNLDSLHKWGYGTDPNPDAPGIEGADNFITVLGLPLPNNVRPVCYSITDKSRTSAVKVKDLKVEIGEHKQPYISNEGKVLFPVPPELKSYHQDSFIRSVHKRIKEHPAANSL